MPQHKPALAYRDLPTCGVDDSLDWVPSNDNDNNHDDHDGDIHDDMQVDGNNHEDDDKDGDNDHDDHDGCNVNGDGKGKRKKEGKKTSGKERGTGRGEKGKRKGGAAKGPKGGRGGDRLILQDDPVERKGKHSDREYFVEDLGSLAGQARYWDPVHHKNEDVVRAQNIAQAMHVDVKRYAALGNALVEVLLEAVKVLGGNDASPWPLCSNAFWVSCLQAQLLHGTIPQHIRGVDIVGRARAFGALPLHQRAGTSRRSASRCPVMARLARCLQTWDACLMARSTQWPSRWAWMHTCFASLSPLSP